MTSIQNEIASQKDNYDLLAASLKQWFVKSSLYSAIFFTPIIVAVKVSQSWKTYDLCNTNRLISVFVAIMAYHNFALNRL